MTFRLQVTPHPKSLLLPSILYFHPSDVFTPPPPGWCSGMDDFTLDLVSKGENLESIRILLETEWPELAGSVDLRWLRHKALEWIGPNGYETI